MGALPETKPEPGGRKITTTTAAEIIGVDPETMRRYGHDGWIDMLDVGRGRVRPTYRFYLPQVQWLERQLRARAANRHAS